MGGSEEKVPLSSDDGSGVSSYPGGPGVALPDGGNRDEERTDGEACEKYGYIKRSSLKILAMLENPISYEIENYKREKNLQLSHRPPKDAQPVIRQINRSQTPHKRATGGRPFRIVYLIGGHFHR
jgi:hypothetical protein